MKAKQVIGIGAGVVVGAAVTTAVILKNRRTIPRGVTAVEPFKYALVMGRNLDYMWILSRDTTLPGDVMERFLRIAGQTGYDLSKLVWTKQ